MNNLGCPYYLYVLILSILLVAAGCGGESTDGGSGWDFGEDETDCEEDQIYDPNTSSCVDDISSPQCDDDEIYDADIGECVPDGGDNDRVGPDDCEDDEVYDPDTEQCVDAPCGVVTITARTCKPDGDDLGEVALEIEGQGCDGPFSLSTTSGDDGELEIIDIPHGNYEITMTKGLFERQFELHVNALGIDTDVDLDELFCFAGDEVDIAVFEGAYDDAAGLLDSMDVAHDLIARTSSSSEMLTFLEDGEALNEYDLIIIECGVLWNSVLGGSSSGAEPGDAEVVIANLQDFVGSGNHLITADFAYRFFEMPFPEAASFGEDEDSSSPRGSVQSIMAEVVTDALSAFLGESTIGINYGEAAWYLPVDVGPDSVVHLKGGVETTDSEILDDMPLLVTHHDPSGGTATYQSFHSDSADDGESKLMMEFFLFHQ